MKICVAIGLLVLASLHGASAVAEPIGPEVWVVFYPNVMRPLRRMQKKYQAS